jgi:hypothetical protein
VSGKNEYKCNTRTMFLSLRALALRLLISPLILISREATGQEARKYLRTIRR